LNGGDAIAIQKRSFWVILYGESGCIKWGGASSGGLRYRVDNVRGLAFYISDSVSMLGPHAKELAMDATFGTDKDTSEIFAVHQTWPNTIIQLCYWHARRAIRTKLASAKKTNI